MITLKHMQDWLINPKVHQWKSAPDRDMAAAVSEFLIKQEQRLADLEDDYLQRNAVIMTKNVTIDKQEELLEEVQEYLLKKHNWGTPRRASVRLELLNKIVEILKNDKRPKKVAK